jgi:hypothetical protein
MVIFLLAIHKNIHSIPLNLFFPSFAQSRSWQKFWRRKIGEWGMGGPFSHKRGNFIFPPPSF